MTFLQSIRGRLILSLMVSVLLVTLVIAGFASYRAEKMVEGNRGELLSQLAQGMSYQLNKDMQSRAHEIQMLTELSDIKNAAVNLTQKRAIFEKMRASYPYYAWIGMTDASGNILAGTDGLLEGKNVAKRSWFLEGSQKVHLGSVHDAFLLAKIMPKPKWDDLPLRLVDISAPIRNEKGELLGVVCGHLGWDWAFEMRHKMLASPNLKHVDLLVVKNDGSLLMGTSKLPSASLNISGLLAFQSALLDYKGVDVETWPDQQVYMTAVSYEQSPENKMLEWVVVAKESLDEVMISVNDSKRQSLSVLLIVMLVLWWLVWKIVSRSTQELQALTLAADGINQGNSDIKIPTYERQDEVGVLASSLSKLVTSLQNEVHQKTAVANQLQLMARVYDDSPQGVIITDADKCILSVNSAFTEVTGYTEADSLGQTPAILRSGRQDQAFYDNMWQSVKTAGRWQGEIWNRSKSGEVFPEWLLISALKNSQGEVTHYIGIFSDLTDKKEAENQLVFLANHDVLTLLPNRRLLQDSVNRVLHDHAERQAGLIFLDLDFFKSINDSLGHLVGDQLLKVVANTLSKQFDKPNLVARFGGDEFVIFMPNIQQRVVLEEMAQSLVKTFEQPFVVGDYTLQVGLTMGISVYPQDGLNAESLIQAADTAMYDIKRNHAKSYQFYSASMREAAFEKLLLERDLKSALSNQEFYLVYQPQIHLDNNCLKGVEALLRWKHPRRGLVYPNIFIPALEEMGLIDTVGLWVVREALAQYNHWQKIYGLSNITLSINLSAIQLRNPKLTELLMAEVANAKVPFNQMVFEVTESVMIEDDARIQREFDTLRQAGCQFALDDYGTGYSNLAYIDKFNLSELKIDQAFIQRMQSDEADRLIVHHTIEMAKALGMKVVLEGVETQAQIDALRQYSELVVQGYYFDKPLSVAEMEQRLAERRDFKWLPCVVV